MTLTLTLTLTRYGGSLLPVAGGLGVVAVGAVGAKAWSNGRKPSSFESRTGLATPDMYQNAQVSDA